MTLRKAIPRSIRHLFARSHHSGWHARRNPKRGRRRALREEREYWEYWLSTRGGNWSDDYAYRLDPMAEVEDPVLREILNELPGEEIRILDVGAGPISSVGYRCPGKTLSLVPVDPLADEYARLLASAGVVPPIPTERAEGERLLATFAPETFDVVYARNALDHAVDPKPIVENMLTVARPGGFVVLRHVRNEAVRQHYVQLHQWNFDDDHGHLIVWRPGYRLDVTDMLGERADVRCLVEPNGVDQADAWIIAVIRKRRDARYVR